MRHPALLTRDCIFVLVDVQDKLFVHIHGKEKVQKNIELLLRFARIFNIPLVVTEHYPKGLGATIPEIKVLIEGARIHEKVTFSCCGNEGFSGALKGLPSKTLVIFGIETHICVEQTAMDALTQGYKVHVIADAVSSRAEENHRLSLKKMRQFGAVITSTESVLYEIMERKDIKEFKEVLPLLK